MSRPLFSLIQATARTPLGWAEAMHAWRERCDDPSRVEYILCADEAKKPAVLMPILKGVVDHAKWSPFRAIFNEGRPCAVDAWNTAATHATGDIIITVADDYFPPEHWDTAIMRIWGDRFDHLGEFVLDVDNQDNSYPLLPFSFISRAYYERLGYLFWPEYFGLGADNDFTEVARRDGVVIDARNLKFEHRHPHNGLGIWDEVYEWQQRPEAVEAQYRVFERRKKEGFPALSQAMKDEYYARLRVPAPGSVGVTV